MKKQDLMELNATFGKLILHYTYNGVVNTVTEEMGLSD